MALAAKPLYCVIFVSCLQKGGVVITPFLDVYYEVSDIYDFGTI